MRTFIFLLLFPSFLVYSENDCLKSIESPNIIGEIVFRACIRATMSHSKLNDAILEGKFEHDFGTYEKPSKEFLLLKSKINEQDPHLMYIFSLIIEAAFITHREKWNILNGSDDGYREHYKTIKAEADLWRNRAAFNGSVDAILWYIDTRYQKAKFMHVTIPAQEVEYCLKFADALKLESSKFPKVDLNKIEEYLAYFKKI